MRRALALAGLIWVAMAPAPAGADPLPTGAVVATSPALTPISAGRGIATFSMFDARTKRFRLAVSDGTDVRLLGAPARRGAFDASVGVDDGGRTVVTYTQCRRVTFGTGNGTYVPYWPAQSGCRVKSVDVASGRIRTLDVERTEGASLWLPVQAGRELAYGRLLDRGVRRVTVRPGGEDAYRDRIHRYRFEIVRRTAGGRTRVLRGGPVANAPVSQANGQDLGVYGAGPTSIDFDGRRVAYSWLYASESCPSDGSGAERPYANAVYVERGGTRTRLAKTCAQKAAGTLSSVDLQGDAAWWLHLTPGTSAYLSTPFVGTGTVAGPASEAPVAAPPPMSVVATSVDGQARWYVLTDGQQVSITRATSGS